MASVTVDARDDTGISVHYRQDDKHNGWFIQFAWTDGFIEEGIIRQTLYRKSYLGEPWTLAGYMVSVLESDGICTIMLVYPEDTIDRWNPNECTEWIGRR